MAKHTVKRNLAALAIPILMMFWNPAAAQQGVKCFPYDAAMAHLNKNTSERMAGAGVDAHGNLVTLHAAPTGEWTIVVRLMRDGAAFACPLSAGQGWQVVTEKMGQPS